MTIQTSRPALIRIVTFLLSECRKSLCTETPLSLQEHEPTLSSLMSHTLKGKRKRTITHFDGIPLSVLPPAPSSPPIPERRIITLRRAMGLYKTMSGISISGESQDSNSAEDMDNDGHHFACLYTSEPSSIENDYEDDRESSIEESDSDDEDDVVLMFNRPS
ncbi:uncharacterized protein IAS62_002243 [Cryptococcus decagattii]|uniref:Uncharacterized protein n=1 Tax=Cryptococcus decagattii TaxID=1859122 RepID=A0ABZ2AU29_9TREE